MKTGMNLLLWTTHVGPEHYRTMARIKEAGFDGVEIPLFEGDASHYKGIRAELDKLGLGCTTVTCVGPEHSPISADASVRKAALGRLKWAIEMTAALKGDLMAGPFHSPLAVFSGQPPTEDEKKRAADVLHQAAEFAVGANVKLAIEYLNRFECYFLNTAADTAALVQRVNHPSFRAMYDTFHANIEEKSAASAIAALGDRMIHVHISENDRGIPGTGMVHWKENFQALKKARYDGWLTIEAFGRALPALAAATKVWRDLFPSAEEVCTKGLAFIKQQWTQAVA
jgi:D-psicose/D-tagatose/L-ribulose 3-epimerase